MKKSTQYFLVGVFTVLFIAAFGCFIWYNANKLVLRTNEPALQTSLIEERIPRGTEKENVVYCNNQKLDFYAPTDGSSKKVSLVIFVHGGGWRMNNKDSDQEVRGLFEGLRGRGYALASIDYSLTPQYQYPKPQQDVLCAVRFMRANAVRFAIDADKIALAGFSAGANLAALAGTNSDLSTFGNGLYTTTSSTVQAVVGIGGVYDFGGTLHPNSVGNIKNLMQNNNPLIGSPTTYISSKAAPMLLLYGTKDSVVYPVQSTNYAKLLTKNGVENSVVLVQNAEHDLSAAGGAISPSRDQIVSIIKDFIDKTLGR